MAYTIPVQSTIDNDRDELFHADFTFINGQCQNPMLTVTFEEVCDSTKSIEILKVWRVRELKHFSRCCHVSSELVRFKSFFQKLLSFSLNIFEHVIFYFSL